MDRNTALAAAGALVITVAAGATALSFAQQPDQSPKPVVSYVERPSDPIVVVVPSDGSAPSATTRVPAEPQQYQNEPSYADSANYEEYREAHEEYVAEESEYEEEDYEDDEYEADDA